MSENKYNIPESDSTDAKHDQKTSEIHIDEWEIDNLPNRLTLFRVALIPVIIGSLFLCSYSDGQFVSMTKILNYIAAWTFVGASITDFLDGYIARKRNIVTVFGSFLDPIADKFLVVSSLIMLNALGRIPVLVVITLVIREMYMTALRLLANERGLKIPVSDLGKWKTTFQMIAIPMLMAWDKPFGIPLILMGQVFIYLAFFFSTYSALIYTMHLVQKISAAKKLKKQTT